MSTFVDAERVTEFPAIPEASLELPSALGPLLVRHITKARSMSVPNEAEGRFARSNPDMESP